MARRMMVMTEGQLDLDRAKTGVSAIRYCPDEIACVLDSTHAGEDLHGLVGTGRGVPIVATAREGLELGANTLLIGIAGPGGRLPDEWRGVIRECLAAGMDVLNGLHVFLGEIDELAALARSTHATITDLRRPPDDLTTSRNVAKQLDARRVLTVGTDCNSGKMSVSLELRRLARERGHDAGFVATGQTGIVIEGSGIAVDRVIADFCAGAAEQLVLEQQQREILFVEGQGSLNHPSYSGVTLGLLHGCAPTDLILCHVCTRSVNRSVEFGEPLPAFTRLIATYEDIASYILPCTVRGIALNTAGLSDAEARAAVEQATADTGLPATDIYRFGAEPLADALGL